MPRDLLKDGVSAAQDNEDFIWEPQEATEEEVRQLMQQAMKEANEEYLATIVYDAGSGKRMPLRQFEKKYGTDEFSKELVHAAEIRAQYSRETAGKIKSLHAKLMRPDKPPTPRAKPESKPAIQTKPGKAIQDQFIPVPYRFVDKVKGAGCHHNPTALLMILLKHRTWKGKMDKHHTYTYWYRQKGLIVASRSMASLAEELGTCERTVRKYLRQLEENGRHRNRERRKIRQPEGECLRPWQSRG
jgi:DNA-binding phage protein